MPKYTKDPDAILDYTVDWSDWLATGDTISSVASSVQTGITRTTQTNTTTTHTIWLSGGTEGQEYEVTSRIDTAGGRTDERTIIIRVNEK